MEKQKKTIRAWARRAGRFCWKNKAAFLQVAFLMAAVPAVGACNSASSIAVTPLKAPMQLVTTLLTGPVPACFTVISGAVAGIAWGAGWEQQIMQRALKCVGGGAIATSVGSGMDWIGIDGVSSCLFL